MGKCLSTENLYGGFIHHVAAVINNPVLTVRGIRIKGNVRNHTQLGKRDFSALTAFWTSPSDCRLPYRRDFWIPARRPERARWREYPVDQFLRFLKKKVNTQTTDLRHRGYRLLVARSLFDEHGRIRSSALRCVSRIRRRENWSRRIRRMRVRGNFLSV